MFGKVVSFICPACKEKQNYNVGITQIYEIGHKEYVEVSCYNCEKDVLVSLDSYANTEIRIIIEGNTHELHNCINECIKNNIGLYNAINIVHTNLIEKMGIDWVNKNSNEITIITELMYSEQENYNYGIPIKNISNLNHYYKYTAAF